MRPFLPSRVLLLATALMLVVAAGLPRAADAADAGGLVSALTSQLGVSKPQAEGGAGALFNLAKQRMNPDQFGQVENQVPGIGGLMGAAPGGSKVGGSTSGGSDGGGLAGMTSGALGGMTGGSGGGLGALAPLAGSFSSLGLSPDMATKFLPVVLEYLNSSGGGGAAGLLKGALTG
ncbi:DUF2780 domain-containing protein [Skermanella pratensis]|uniref:DUF2780 domain-containing protein n=1 Tax=Skermanella pratensis TaxID=2233999 RepID=UPI001B3BA66A|nr:DUF2780 domain-containing protein [Skermanella pratensis]